MYTYVLHSHNKCFSNQSIHPCFRLSEIVKNVFNETFITLQCFIIAFVILKNALNRDEGCAVIHLNAVCTRLR